MKISDDKETCCPRKSSLLTWLTGVSRACGALQLSVTDSDQEFCASLKQRANSSSNQVPLIEIG